MFIPYSIPIAVTDVVSFPSDIHPFAPLCTLDAPNTIHHPRPARKPPCAPHAAGNGRDERQGGTLARGDSGWSGEDGCRVA